MLNSNANGENPMMSRVLKGGSSLAQCESGKLQPDGEPTAACPINVKWGCTASGCKQTVDGEYATKDQCEAKGACGRWVCENKIETIAGENNTGCVWTKDCGDNQCIDKPDTSACNTCFGYLCNSDNAAGPGQCGEGGKPCTESGESCNEKLKEHQGGWKTLADCKKVGGADGGKCRPYGCVGAPVFALEKHPDGGEPGGTYPEDPDEYENGDKRNKAFGDAKAAGAAAPNKCALVNSDSWERKTPKQKAFLNENKLLFKSLAECEGEIGENNRCVGYTCTGLQ